MSKELVKIENIVPEKVFVENGLSSVIKDIENQIKPLVFDISSDKGRKELTSICYKIKRTKTAIDSLGKDYVAELKKQPKIVDAERKRAREALEDLEAETRRPLTEWEDSEKKRKDTILAMINDIDPFQSGMITISIGEYTLDELKSMEAKAGDFVVDDSLAEFKDMGAKKKEGVTLKLAGIIAQQEKHEAEQAELERLRKEAAEREQREHEDRIAREAAERAQKEAEAKAEQERQSLIKKEREAKEAQERAEREKLEAEQRAKVEQERAVKAERDRLEKIERDRLAKEEAERKATEKKAANKRHRAKINNEILKAFVDNVSEIDDANAKLIVQAIVKGEIPHVTINY